MIETEGRTFEMNPLTWRREHQVALLLGTALGVVLGLVVGFVHNDIHLATFGAWSADLHSFRWGAMGALVGAGVVYIQRLLRS
jgi:hypothetical protein